MMAEDSVVAKVKASAPSSAAALSGGSLAFLILLAPFGKNLLDAQLDEQRRMSTALMDVRDEMVGMRVDVRQLRDGLARIDELEETVQDISRRQDALAADLERLRRCIKNRKDCL